MSTGCALDENWVNIVVKTARFFAWVHIPVVTDYTNINNNCDYVSSHNLSWSTLGSETPRLRERDGCYCSCLIYNDFDERNICYCNCLIHNDIDAISKHMGHAYVINPTENCGMQLRIPSPAIKVLILPWQAAGWLAAMSLFQATWYHNIVLAMNGSRLTRIRRSSRPKSSPFY